MELGGGGKYRTLILAKMYKVLTEHHSYSNHQKKPDELQKSNFHKLLSRVEDAKNPKGTNF